MHIILPVASAPVGVYVHSSPRKGPAHSWDFSNTRGYGGGTAVIISPMHPVGTHLTLCFAPPVSRWWAHCTGDTESRHAIRT